MRRRLADHACAGGEWATAKLIYRLAKPDCISYCISGNYGARIPEVERATMTEGELGLSPLCLIVPGLHDSGPGHWQTIWERERHDCLRVQLGMWSDPVRNVWISRIDQAVAAAQGPVVLVAHSLGCQAVLWWASLLGEDARGNVVGALLVAPPDVDRLNADPQIERFAPVPQSILPFPTTVVASSDDPWCEPERAEEMAGAWNAHFVLLDQAGHINAESGLGAWREGQELLERVLDVRPRTPSAFAWPATASQDSFHPHPVER